MNCWVLLIPHHSVLSRQIRGLLLSFGLSLRDLNRTKDVTASLMLAFRWPWRRLIITVSSKSSRFELIAMTTIDSCAPETALGASCGFGKITEKWRRWRRRPSTSASAPVGRRWTRPTTVSTRWTKWTGTTPAWWCRWSCSASSTSSSSLATSSSCWPSSSTPDSAPVGSVKIHLKSLKKLDFFHPI